CPATDIVWGWASANTAGLNPWCKTDYAGNNYKYRLFRPRGGNDSISIITDGTSNTILVGEKVVDPQAYNAGGWLWDEPMRAGGPPRRGGGGGTSRSGPAAAAAPPAASTSPPSSSRTPPGSTSPTTGVPPTPAALSSASPTAACAPCTTPPRPR